MAPDGACEVAQGKARSNAEFEAERFRNGFRKKHESVVESSDACSSRGSEGWIASKHARTVILSAQWLPSTPEP